MSLDARRPGRGESGQSLVLLVLGMTVMFVIGAIVVDIGLWLSERRGAQTDADFAATAGAWELLRPGASASDAVTAATSSLSANDEQGNAAFANPVQVDDSCWDRGVNDAVTVDVSHGSRGLFFDIFGLTNPDIGAHAKACVGAAQGIGDIVPFHVTDNPGPCFDTNEEPIFTALCDVERGAHGSNPRGLLDLEADQYCSNRSGSGDPEELIENGAQGLCLIDENGNCEGGSGPQQGYYDCVYAQTGNTANIQAGVNARVSKDGDCDALYGNGNGTDDFLETIQIVFNTGNPTTSIYEARDCDLAADGLQKSPRLVTLVVLENEADQNDPEPIIAFAGFYLSGCGDERITHTDETLIDPYCGPQQAGADVQPALEAYVAAPELGPVLHHRCTHGNPPAFTCTPTPSPVPTPTPTPTPAPTASPSPAPTASPTPSPAPTGTPGCPQGHCTVFGRFVKLIVSNADIGRPTGQTTLFGISLVE